MQVWRRPYPSLVNQTARSDVGADPYEACILSPSKGQAVAIPSRVGGDLGRSGVPAPVPTTAKEDVTSDPSPCPLPEGEGSPREQFQLPTRSIQTLSSVQRPSSTPS